MGLKKPKKDKLSFMELTKIKTEVTAERVRCEGCLFLEDINFSIGDKKYCGEDLEKIDELEKFLRMLGIIL